MKQRIVISKNEIREAILKMKDVAEANGSGALALFNDYLKTLVNAPASTDIKYGNAIEGGYIDERNRIYEIAVKICESRGIDTDIDTSDEFLSLAFLCFFGDVGVLGINPKTPFYVDSEAWMKKRGQMYQRNPNHPNMTASDLSLFLLNSYKVTLTPMEFLGVKLSGGLHLEENKHYASAYRGSTLLDNEGGIVRIYLMAKELAKQDIRKLSLTENAKRIFEDVYKERVSDEVALD